MVQSYEAQKAQRAANIAAGLRYDGKPRVERKKTGPRRDHVAEVEYLHLIVGLPLEGVASDMELAPSSVLRALERKGRYDLIRRLDPEREHRGSADD